ncbi:MAG TPA: hypothetical protein VFA83_03335 [Acidimicrobiales bacterium]|nr:hypothetical protein [Acidimicrobiales bacterium]
MRRRSLLVWAAGAALLVGMVVLPAAARAQAAAEIADTGWWTQSPAPNAPAGGFEVAEGPQGPLSVAAFHIRVEATTLTQAVLTLSESQVVGTPTLQVCPTTSVWTPATGGAYSSAPTPNCATSVTMTRNATGAVDTADIRKLIGPGPTTVSLMVVPLPGAAPVQVPFDATFSAATMLADGDIEPAAAADTGSGSASSGTSGSSFGFDTSPPAAVGVGPSPDLGAAPFPALSPTPSPADQPAAAAPAQEVGRFPTAGQVGLPKGHGADKPWGRAWVFAIVALAVGALAAFARRWLHTLGWLEST